MSDTPSEGLREALTKAMPDIAAAMPWYDEANPDYADAIEVAFTALTASPQESPSDSAMKSFQGMASASVAALRRASPQESSGIDVKRVEKVITAVMRQHVRSPEEGGDSIDAAIGSAILDVRARLLSESKEQP